MSILSEIAWTHSRRTRWSRVILGLAGGKGTLVIVIARGGHPAPPLLESSRTTTQSPSSKIDSPGSKTEIDELAIYKSRHDEYSQEVIWRYQVRCGLDSAGSIS